MRSMYLPALALILAISTVSDAQAQSNNAGLSARKIAIKNATLQTLSQGEIIAMVGLALAADIDCDGVELDQTYHDSLEADFVKVVAHQRKARRDRDGRRYFLAFQQKYGLVNQKDNRNLCAAFRKEITEGSFLGAVLKLN